MASVDEVVGGTLGELNAGAAAAVGFVTGLGAQLDAFITFGLGPFQVDTALQFDATVAASASLTLKIGNPLAALEAALAAVAQLQAQISAGLALPPVQVSFSAALGASAALVAALSARLGLIEGLISAALDVKLPAARLAGELAASLSAGPAIALVFDGISDGTTLAEIGGLVAAKFAGGLSVDGVSIAPTSPVSGIILLTEGASVYASMSLLLLAA